MLETLYRQKHNEGVLLQKKREASVALKVLRRPIQDAQ